MRRIFTAVLATGIVLGYTVVAHAQCDTSQHGSIVLDSVATFQFAADYGVGGGTDCWGWKGPDEIEYAIMGTEYGIVFVNATAFRVVDSVQGPGPCGYMWRDIKTYRHYCYAVSDCQGDLKGLMIIDLQYLPDSVHLVGIVTIRRDDPLDKSHNISIDTARGFLYAVDDFGNGALSGDFRVLSLEDPESPVQVADVYVPAIHDLYARNDTVWVAEGGNGSWSIWDMADKDSPIMLTRINVPGGTYIHNVWPSEDGSVVASTDETPSKFIRLWDTSDLSQVRLTGSFLGPSQLVHNAIINGPYVFTSHYESGVVVRNIFQPSCLATAAQFDTFDGEDPEFLGCWGVYPFTSNSLVYASNIDGRLFLLSTDDTLAYAYFESDVRTGQAPLTVSFTDQSHTVPAGWDWSFGDGTSSGEQHPVHVYGGGLYDVDLGITSTEGSGHMVRHSFITVLGADTLQAKDTALFVGRIGSVDIISHNALPIETLVLPFQLTNTAIVLIDSVRTTGTRTANFESLEIAFDDRYNSGRMVVRLKADAGGGTAPLPPGDGPILRVFFHVKASASAGETAEFISLPISQFSLVATTLTMDFVPVFLPGTVTVASCTCPYQSDFDEDGFITAIDLGATIDILFAGQPDPRDPDCLSTRADFDCDGFTTPLDLSTLIDLLYSGGDSPCDPCHQ